MSDQIQTYQFIINPQSGRSKRREHIITQIKSSFAENTAKSYEIQFTEYPGHAYILAKEAREKEIDLVVSVGGDGTMNEVARALVHGNTALGLIPSGSGNGYARSLKIPLKPVEALRLLLDAPIRTIDSGKVNQHYFFGLTGIGFDAEVGAQFQEFGQRGPLPYFYLGLKTFFQFDYERLIIKTDQFEKEVHPLVITVANTAQYGNGAVIAPCAIEDDGLLEICIFSRPTLVSALRSVYHLFNETIDKMPQYTMHRAARVKIRRTKQNSFIHIDGEPVKAVSELEISVQPNSLRVCAPID